MDAGEPFDEAMVREAAEETRPTISLSRVAGAGEHELPHVRVAILYTEARVLAGKVRLSGEHNEFAWVSRKELGRMDISDQLRPFVLRYAAAATE